MRQYSCQVCEETFVKSKHSLSLDSPKETVKCTVVQITCLVVHSTHDRVGWMHHATHHKTATTAACQVKSRAILHPKMLLQRSFRKEICWKLHGTTEACANHCWANTSVQPLYTFCAVYLPQPVQCIFIVMLCANGKYGRE